MPSLRRTLTTDQKQIALYSDPIALHLAHFVATELLGAQPDSEAYQKHATNFMLTLEARLHGNRLKADANARLFGSWALRRELVIRLTGRDMLLSESPTEEVVRNWLYRFVPSAVRNVDKLTSAELRDRLSQAAEEYRKGLPSNLERLRDEFERLTMQFAREVGQFGGLKQRKSLKPRNLIKLNDRNLCTADGTYLSPFSQVSWYIDEDGNVRWLDSRADRESRAKLDNGEELNERAGKGTPKVQSIVQHSGKDYGPAAGVNHVAIITRSKYGRIVLSVERALGGEVHGALQAMDRIAPLALGGIRGLVYDKALSGWQIDYLLAVQGILSVVEPTAAKKEAPAERDAAREADALFADREADAGPEADNDECRPTANDTTAITKKAKKSKKRVGKKIRADIARRILGRKYDVDLLVEAAKAGMPLGADLPLGTSVYLDSRNNVRVVESTHAYFRIERYTHPGGGCAHELHVDDGALWLVREKCKRGVTSRVKHERLTCVSARTKIVSRTGWHMLQSVYLFICPDTGEIHEVKIDHTPSGTWRPKNAKVRDARHQMQPIARCDRGWRKICGRRNDSESWFSWLKNQLLEDQRAASLDLNHQFLDVLSAAILTNAMTRHYWRLEEHL